LSLTDSLTINRDGEDLISPVSEREISLVAQEEGKQRWQGRQEWQDGREQYPGNYTRLFINLGKTDGFFPEQLIELVIQILKEESTIGKMTC